MLIQQGTTASLSLIADDPIAGIPSTQYMIASAGALTPGAGSFVAFAGGGSIVLTAGETAMLGQLMVVLADGTNNIRARQECQVVAYDPAAGGDPWAAALPGGYPAGQAGNILGNLPGSQMSLTPPTLAAIAAGGLGLGTVFEGSFTLQDFFRVAAAILAGKLQTTGQTAIYRSWTNAKNRAVVTLAAGGQRTSVTLDLS
jgi:hypothetical protein